MNTWRALLFVIVGAALLLGLAVLVARRCQPGEPGFYLGGALQWGCRQ